MELSIDTSTAWGGLALSQEGCLLAGLTWKPGQNHTSEMFPNIDRLLATAKADIRDMRAIFVARGPGSYNGLRAGLSAAKGLAFSLSIPLVGISTLEIEAYPFAFSAMPICPLQDAGRGEIASALYSFDGNWKCLKEAYLTTIDSLCKEIKVKTLFCGEIPPAAVGLITSTLGPKAVVPEWHERSRRPGCLAALGWQKLSSGEKDNLATLQPIYLRQPPITKSKKKYQGYTTLPVKD
ncbi:MAG: tRNA (adenosine(37)-N6)-threonylcarbamoyltransferase complex dimerization subunit type 1 TsaB [Dehalococcoidia bacterium]